MSFTVLIADDEAMPRTVLKEHIPWEELSVTQVHLATDGEEAVEQARRFRPEIIIKCRGATGWKWRPPCGNFCPRASSFF